MQSVPTMDRLGCFLYEIWNIFELDVHEEEVYMDFNEYHADGTKGPNGMTNAFLYAN